MSVRSQELKLQDDIVDYLNKHHIWHLRMNMGFLSGIPDIIAIYKGMFIGIELKRPDGKGRATKQQEKIIQEIKNAGGIAGLVSNKTELIELLNKVHNNNQKDKIKEDDFEWLANIK